MRRWLLPLGLTLALQCGAFADTLKLLDGKVITGTFLGGDARTIRMEVNNKIEMFPISEVDSLSFGGGLAGAVPPEKIDPKKAKEEEKARKKAEEQATKMAKEAEKAKKEAEKAAARAEEAAAKAKGATSAIKAPGQAPKMGRFGKPSGLSRASDAANAAKTPPPAVGSAAQTAQKVSNTANQAVTAANQAASVAADPAAAASGAAQQAVGIAQQAAVGAASPAAGVVAPVVSNAQAVESTVETARSVARTASNARVSGRDAAGGSAATPSSANTASQASGSAQPSHSQAGTASPAPAAVQSVIEHPPSPVTAPAPAQPKVSDGAASERAQPENATVATGTLFRVRMVEAINTAIHHPGEVFRASLESPLVSGGVPVPKGADVMLRLVKLPPARGSGIALFSLEAVSYRVDNRNLPLAAELMTQPGDALRNGSSGNGVQVLSGAEAIRIPVDGLVSLRVIRPANKR